jgi:hypothetical protein
LRRAESSLGDEIALHLFFVVFGFVLIRATMKGTNILINPPEWLRPWIGRKTPFWELIEWKIETYLYYFMGVSSIVMGGVGLIQRLIVLASRFE